jgi:hypothetical protein
LKEEERFALAEIPGKEAVTQLCTGAEPLKLVFSFRLTLDYQPGARESTGGIGLPATQTGGCGHGVRMTRLVD